MKVLNIVFSAALGLAAVVIIILSIVISCQSRTITDLRIKNNLTGQTIEQLKQESIKQSEILQEKEKQLDRLKTCESFRDYLKIWDEINRSTK